MTLEQVLKKQSAQFLTFERDQLQRLKPIFDQAKVDLLEKLSALHARDRDDAFTAVMMRRTLAQVQQAINDIEKQIEGVVISGAVEADNLSLSHLLEQDRIATQQFGAPQQIDVEGIERLARDNSLLIERTRSLTENWTKRSIEQVRGTLAVEMAKQTPVSEVVSNLAAKDGPMEGRRADAQRLVRTEMAHHYNARTHERMEVAAKSAMIKPKKRMINVIDSRTALDTLAIIAEPGNLVKEVDEPFHDPRRGRWFDHPPNRPNDRARIVMFYGSEWEQKAIKDEQAKAAKFEKEALERESLAATRKRRPTEGTTPDGRAKKTPEPPPVEEVAEGVHIAKLVEGPLSRALAKATLQVFESRKLTSFLKEHPLGEVGFVDQIARASLPGGLVAGRYKDGNILVVANQPHGVPWRPGITSTVSLGMRTQQQARQTVLLHEFAHHLHEVLGRENSSPIIRIIQAAHRVTGSPISERALKGGRLEYFAESFSAWFMRKEDLRVYDPDGYEMIHKVLKLGGIPSDG